MSLLTLYVLIAVFCAAALTTAGQLTLTQLNVEFADLKKRFNNFNQNVDSQCKCVAGNVYTRWGKANCPNGTETLYSGTLGGSWYGSAGGSANHLCMPPNPVYDNHANPTYTTLLYGGEYETHPEPTQNLNTQCSVCRTTRSSVVMIPAANTCQTGWTLEYTGYLMAGYRDHGSATEFICVDSSFDFLPGTQANDDGRLLYYTVSKCGSLACPNYIDNRIIVCAVCTK